MKNGSESSLPLFNKVLRSLRYRLSSYVKFDFSKRVCSPDIFWFKAASNSPFLITGAYFLTNIYVSYITFLSSSWISLIDTTLIIYVSSSLRWSPTQEAADPWSQSDKLFDWVWTHSRMPTSFLVLRPSPLVILRLLAVLLVYSMLLLYASSCCFYMFNCIFKTIIALVTLKWNTQSVKGIIRILNLLLQCLNTHLLPKCPPCFTHCPYNYQWFPISERSDFSDSPFSKVKLLKKLLLVGKISKPIIVLILLHYGSICNLA